VVRINFSTCGQHARDREAGGFAGALFCRARTGHYGGTGMSRNTINPTDKYVGSRLRMRRLMLDMSQTNIADALGLTFQQVQKYEKGSNRISASRLQHLSQILQVPVPFFFEGAPAASAGPVAKTAADDYSYVADFLATADGLDLVKAFVSIEDPELRRAIVRLVEALALESA
jgi:transcriptional regulator with XRE-family HTH domain